MRRAIPSEMRADATQQFRRLKRVDEMQSSIKPGKEFILDLIVHCKRDLGAIGPNFREIHQTHQIDVSAHRFKSALVRRIAVDGQEETIVRLRIPRDRPK